MKTEKEIREQLKELQDRFNGVIKGDYNRHSLKASIFLLEWVLE